jgi:catechol 2,3-dioxygenase-like lactoylglutathione lyase family enzyme
MLRRINFQSLPVTDQQRALEFYRDRLGMEVQTDAPFGDGWRWIFMAIPGAETLLHFAQADEISIKSGTPALCLVAEDVDAEIARLQGCGVTITHSPALAPWNPHVRWAMFKDSEDNLILIQSSSMEGT